VPVRDSSQRLADWIEHWSATTLEAPSRKESTKVLYRGLARKHLSANPFGAILLDKLRKSHIDGLLVALRNRGCRIRLCGKSIQCCERFSTTRRPTA
jgi:hypothetical protein